MALRGERVMLDRDLAELYGVSTKALNQAATRNRKRFPPDFMFRLLPQEKDELVTNCDHLLHDRRKYRMTNIVTVERITDKVYLL